jgi:23S rRNA U2552 (ribose-2'-O)-methylase RlmE/FtsJ
MSSGAPDFFFREAKRLNYVARSAFKLLEIQKKYGVIRPGAAVLDLGCAPGAWLQVVCQHLGPKEKGGAVVGVDVKKVKVPAHYCDSRVKTLSADVLNICPLRLAAMSPSGKGFSVILSDMCPSVSGISSRDAVLSAELAMCTLNMALSSKVSDEGMLDCSNGALSQSEKGLLMPGGSIVIKVLEGEDSSEIWQLCKPWFKRTTWFRPKATRSSSREIYLIAEGQKSYS